MTPQQTKQRIAQFRRLISRRKALAYAAVAAAAPLVPTHASGACSVIKSETGGPFTADGGFGHPDLLARREIFRRDIRANLDGSETQPGSPFTLTAIVVDVARDCAPLAGAAFYLWHCNADGEYSAYSDSSGDEPSSFLRGVQTTDADGRVEFATIYPGRYGGRATHFHARVYKDDSFNKTLKTTQFAFEDSINNALYAADGAYKTSRNRRETPNARDYEFRDGFASQLLDISGSPATGYEGTIVVGVEG